MALSTETIHGNLKRFEFISSQIETLRPKRVLDVGCGNGLYLTAPLAGRFSETAFTGIDSDRPTIDFARAASPLPNLRFEAAEDFQSDAPFDMVIASEVVEHVDDAPGFLRFLRSQLRAGGNLIVTIPNGYGAFELMTAIEVQLHLSGVLPVLSRLPFLNRFKADGGTYSGKADAGTDHRGDADTLAVSPHLNFFSYRRFLRLCESAGLKLIRYQARTFLGGLGFQQALKSQSLLQWNARVADTLSPYLCSGWMFVFVPAEPPAEPRRYTRRLNERARNFFNRKRWGLL